MANMSYCRFQNTLNELRDCAAALDEQMNDESVPKLSDDERYAALVMMEVMANMLNAIGIEVDSHDLPKRAVEALDSLDAQREEA